MFSRISAIIFLSIFFSSFSFAALNSNSSCYDSAPFASSIAPVTNLYTNIESAMDCVSLREGESSLIQRGDTSTWSGYKLTRTSGNNFIVELNIALLPDTHAQPAEAAKQMSAVSTKLQECLREITPYLNGPNGEHLEIKLYDVTHGGAPVPPPINIIADTTNHGIREDAGRWGKYTDCPTITHELMHYMGLVDEYQERSRGYHTNPSTGELIYAKDGSDPLLYNCRIIGPADSIMRSQQNAWASVVSGKKNSLLYPGHFRTVTQPGCASSNKIYYTCANRAYATSGMGKGCPTPNTPSECSNSENGQWLQ